MFRKQNIKSSIILNENNCLSYFFWILPKVVQCNYLGSLTYTKKMAHELMMK